MVLYSAVGKLTKRQVWEMAAGTAEWAGSTGQDRAATPPRGVLQSARRGRWGLRKRKVGDPRLCVWRAVGWDTEVVHVVPQGLPAFLWRAHAASIYGLHAGERVADYP